MRAGVSLSFPTPPNSTPVHPFLNHIKPPRWCRSCATQEVLLTSSINEITYIRRQRGQKVACTARAQIKLRQRGKTTPPTRFCQFSFTLSLSLSHSLFHSLSFPLSCDLSATSSPSHFPPCICPSLSPFLSPQYYQTSVSLP